MYTVQPHASSMRGLGQRGNEALTADIAARLSLTFALLPHAPRLVDLNNATPPLIRWASLIAHVRPGNVGEVPAGVRAVPGVRRLLDVLSETTDLVAHEENAARSEQEALYTERLAVFDEGRTEGHMEGAAAVLAEMGIVTAADYEAKLGVPPPPAVAAHLKR